MGARRFNPLDNRPGPGGLGVVMRACSIAVLLGALPACTATHQHFRPAERAHAESRGGRPAAEYDLGVEQRRWGEVRVWSDGARYAADGPQPGTRVHVGFELENALDVPLVLDLGETRLEGLEINGELFAALSPATPHPEHAAAGHSVRFIDLMFVLPKPVPADEVGPFRVHWVLRGPDDWNYEQYTGFVEDYPPPRPYWGPTYWHVGYGFGWGHRWRY
jgi:hypothetical protein